MKKETLERNNYCGYMYTYYYKPEAGIKMAKVQGTSLKNITSNDKL